MIGTILGYQYGIPISAYDGTELGTTELSTDGNIYGNIGGTLLSD